MKKIKKYICLPLGTLLFCTQLATGVFANTPYETLFKEVNQRHKSIDAPIRMQDSYRYDFENGKPLLTEEDPLIFATPEDWSRKIEGSITEEDAKKEVSYLFRLLRTQYGLYSYFGGDAVFEAAQAAIELELTGKNTMPLLEYKDIVINHLLFIKDSHFIFGDYRFSPYTQLISNEQTAFYQVDGTFYLDSEATMPVVSIEGQPPQNYLKRAIGQNGELTYYMYHKTEKEIKDHVDYRMKYKQNGQEMEKFITLKPAHFLGETAPSRKPDSLTLKTNQAYATFAINDMTFGWGEDAAVKQNMDLFMKSVNTIKKYPLGLIDLRFNSGGDILLASRWFEAYTGKKAEHNYRQLRVRPQDIVRSKCFQTQEQWREYESSMEYMNLTADKYYYASKPAEQFLKNDQTLFVLISQRSASAGEAMADLFRNLENTLLIGVNTEGTLINGANYDLKLPYSGLCLLFGEMLNYSNSTHFQEGYGMEPDIYLTGANLEQRLEQFILKYLEAVPVR